MPSLVLATKLFAPAPRAQLVARPALTDRLDSTFAPGNRLTLLSAPAGFGKTTALSDWTAGLDRRHSGARVAWVSLDEGDDDPARFLAHLVAALAAAGVDVPPDTLDPRRTSLADAAAVLLNAVTRAALAAPGTHWVQVLDDYHAVAAAEVHEAVAFLADHAPAQLHLVLATRSDPPLPLARLRARGQLTEVRAADLRLTPAETRDFLDAVMGLELTPDEVAALQQRTEGWVAGLQLAGLSLRGIEERGEVAAFIEAFTGSNRFVVDYLADEVLARQPEDVRDFLLRTAVLDRFTGALCDALTGRSDGARTLSGLERDNLFVVPLDARRSWYRYHHLFSDVLRARLLAEQPEEVPSLHRRASDWYAAHDLAADAVGHALSAGDVDRAGYLIEAALPEVRRARQDSRLLTWLQSLPEAVRRRSPVLSIWSAWSHLMSGDLDAMEHWLGAAESALAAGARDPELARGWADTEDLRTAPASICVYRASVAQARGDVAGTVLHARRALELAGPGDHLIRGQGGAFLGLAAWAQGRVGEAIETFGAGIRDLHAAGNLVDELDATIVLADMEVAAGRPDRARRLYEDGLQRATAHGEPYPRATADLHVGLAELDRALDDLTGAEEHLETARRLGRHASITENRHRWYVAMAEVRAATGDHGEAQRLLDRAEELYRRGFYPEVRPIPSVRARLAVAAGDLAAANAWARERGLTPEDAPDYLREHEHLTLVRLLLAGDDVPVAAVVRLLDRLHAAALATGRHGSVAEIRALQALARAAAGPEPSQPLTDPLSPRELEVLRLLDTDLTGPDIARRLYVSLNTLRTHTKHVFTKLDVTTRAAAVRRARQLGLLQPPDGGQ